MRFSYYLIYLLIPFVLGCNPEKQLESNSILGKWCIVKVDFANLEIEKFKNEVLEDFKRNEWILKEKHAKKTPDKKFKYNSDSIVNQYFEAIMSTVDSGLYKIDISKSEFDSNYLVHYNSLCNVHNGTIKVSKDSIFIKEISSTDMGCPMDNIAKPFGKRNTFNFILDTLVFVELESKRSTYYKKCNE